MTKKLKLLSREPTNEMRMGLVKFWRRLERNPSYAEAYEVMHDAAPSEATELVRGVLKAVGHMREAIHSPVVGGGSEAFYDAADAAISELGAALAHPDIQEWLNG